MYRILASVGTGGYLLFLMEMLVSNDADECWSLMVCVFSLEIVGVLMVISRF